MKDQIKVKPGLKNLLFPIPETFSLQPTMIGMRFLLTNPRIFLVSKALTTIIPRLIIPIRNPRLTFPILAIGRTIKNQRMCSIPLINQLIIRMRSQLSKTISTSTAKRTTITTPFGTTTTTQIIFKTELLIHHQTLTKTLGALTIILLLFSLLPWKITPNFSPLLITLSSPIQTPHFLQPTKIQLKPNQASRIINQQ